MGLLDSFTFKSKEQRLREQKEFEERVLPFGEEGKQKALATMKAIIVSLQDDQWLLWSYFTSKDNLARYTYLDDEPGGIVKSYKGIANFCKMPPEDIYKIIALARLEARITSLEDYPQQEDILDMAKQLHTNYKTPRGH